MLGRQLHATPIQLQYYKNYLGEL